jgi:hypothetical protein
MSAVLDVTLVAAWVLTVGAAAVLNDTIAPKDVPRVLDAMAQK